MKTLEFHRDEKKDKITVTCADGEVSVFSHCGYCRHCRGIVVGKRTNPSPQALAGTELRKGTGTDDSLMNAAMMFNSLVREGTAVECDDDANEGFRRRF